MIFGKKTEFAIELNLKERVCERWIYGTYFFWFRGIRLGDPEDVVDLRGCINWLVPFAADTGEIVSIRYFNMDRREVFIRLCASMFDYAIPTDLTLSESSLLFKLRSTDPYAYASGASFYNVERLGMSSFNTVYILAIDSSVGQLRFIWKEKGGSIEEHTVEKEQFREVALGMIAFFENIVVEMPF